MQPAVVILNLRAEGGAITVRGMRSSDGWRFSLETNDWTRDEESLDRPNHITNASSWGEVIEWLDRYPWAKLHPREVHPEFRKVILEAVAERLTASDVRDTLALSRWSECCAD
jgi:hypothetical protein